MAIEGMENWEEQKRKMETSPDFHLENRVDPVEKLIEQVGWEDALAQINDSLEQNPDDQEARRQATLIVNLYDGKVQSIKNKLQH